MNNSICNDLYQSCFVDGQQHSILVKAAAFAEISKHFDYICSHEDITEAMDVIMKKFDYIIQVHTNLNHLLQNGQELSDEDSIFRKHAMSRLMDMGFQGHLPVPVYSITRPTFAHIYGGICN